jgi:hypothetical protein
MQTYLFFRKEGFYPVQLKDDADAIKNALHNPGTLRVENVSGETVWELTTH